jgi:hypothetical protein
MAAFKVNQIDIGAYVIRVGLLRKTGIRYPLLPFRYQYRLCSNASSHSSPRFCIHHVKETGRCAENEDGKFAEALLAANATHFVVPESLFVHQ